MIFSIFGRNIRFHFNKKEIKDILSKELQIYPQANNGKSIEAEIIFADKISNSLNLSYYNNPSNHLTFHNGFLMDFGYFKVKFQKINMLQIFVEINNSSYFKKFISLDYNSVIENVGQILHEIVLVPMTFFLNDLAIIHASGFKNRSTNKTYLIGGTGGVGKTSTELFFCRKKAFSFICDDIAVVDINGNVYPNLSFPKIYAYNAENNDLAKLILKNNGIIGKFQWYLMKKLRGPQKVRRRISPLTLYNSYEKYESLVDKYYILFKNNRVNTLKVEQINDNKKLSLISHKIIENEYHVFFKHVLWHEYNCLLGNKTPIITLESIFMKQKKVLDQFFSKVFGKYLVHIPYDISHKKFLDEIEKIII